MEVQVISNGDVIELFLNNKSLGSEKLAEGQGPVQYRKVAYQKGVLLGVAKRKGKEVARDTACWSSVQGIRKGISS
ncbi:MAG: DUF4982 domain-containing protein [Bacteroidia bacterium]|nr:DUF4982 domain-containing protein [Bacteroidia bacterium]